MLVAQLEMYIADPTSVQVFFKQDLCLVECAQQTPHLLAPPVPDAHVQGPGEGDEDELC
jgi:hypothetical protein